MQCWNLSLWLLTFQITIEPCASQAPRRQWSTSPNINSTQISSHAPTVETIGNHTNKPSTTTSKFYACITILWSCKTLLFSWLAQTRSHGDWRYRPICWGTFSTEPRQGLQESESYVNACGRFSWWTFCKSAGWDLEQTERDGGFPAALPTTFQVTSETPSINCLSRKLGRISW